MNYEAIKTRIETLIKAVQEKPRGRVDSVLEPIRESLLEARRQGVRLRDLYDVVKTEAKDISASGFAKREKFMLIESGSQFASQS